MFRPTFLHNGYIFYIVLISTTLCWQTPFSWCIGELQPETTCKSRNMIFLTTPPPLFFTHPGDFLWDPDAVIPIFTCYHKLLCFLPCSFTTLWNSYLSSFCISLFLSQNQILYLQPIRSVLFWLLFCEDICHFFLSASLYKSCFLALLQLLSLFSLLKVLLLLSSFCLSMLSVSLKAGLTDPLLSSAWRLLSALPCSTVPVHAPPPLQVF